MELLFEKSRAGRRAVAVDPLDVPEAALPAELCRSAAVPLPELSELDVVRHFTLLSRRNYGVDSHFYPLGSCTMKYNPKVSELVASHPGFAALHPHLSTANVYEKACQGALELVFETERMLAEIGGMKAGCLQPMAGAHGELTGVLLIAAYHRDRGNTHKRTILIPDSAHGTNPATAAMAGFEVREIPSTAAGTMDFDKLLEALDETVAGVMMTCPNTHGLFEPQVHAVADRAHAVDALLYYDGANLNAIVGKCRPGDLGFDVMHFNLHKTFATPHGMGGPGSGAIAVGDRLLPYLPGPKVVKTADGFTLEAIPKSMGRMAAFFGNFLIAVRAYAFLRYYGGDGLPSVAENAVLNANYMFARLRGAYQAAFAGNCMHECVLSASWQADKGVHALDIAKALLDRGFHAPTIYFPLTVRECMMIEPTETESKETMDLFCDAMLEIARLVDEDPESLHAAPVTRPVSRLDEVRAAKDLNCACLA